jgi:hypothetical protein
MPQPKRNFRPIADAFARVIIVAYYQDKWITAGNYSRIVHYEHDLVLPASMVDSDTLVAALSKDSRFKNADDTSNASGVFRKLYCPSTVQADVTKKSTRV